MSGEQWQHLIRETQAVSLWSCSCLIFRLCVDLLMVVSSMEKEQHEIDSDGNIGEQLKENILWLQQQQQQQKLAFIWADSTTKTIMVTVAIFSSWVLYCFPSKVLFSQCPGFFFGNPM